MPRQTIKWIVKRKRDGEFKFGTEKGGQKIFRN